jgi:CheY-like chemotaxis protein
VLETFPERRPDLMILDLAMPEMDGWQVIERLQGRGRLPPVLLLSERGEDPRRGRFRECIAAYLFKPVRSSEFVGTCRRILDLAERAEGFPEERRREPRRRLIVEVTVLSSEELPACLGRLVDLSPRGFQLELGVPLKLGDSVRALLPVPGSAPLDLEGRIRWCKVLPGGYLVGGELLRIDPEQALILEALLHPLMPLSA